MKTGMKDFFALALVFGLASNGCILGQPTAREKTASAAEDLVIATEELTDVILNLSAEELRQFPQLGAVMVAAGSLGAQPDSILDPDSLDVDALVQTILLETARDADEDLRSMLEELTGVLEKKKEIRDAMESTRDAARDFRDAVREELELVLAETRPGESIENFATSTQVSVLIPRIEGAPSAQIAMPVIATTGRLVARAECRDSNPGALHVYEVELVDVVSGVTLDRAQSTDNGISPVNATLSGPTAVALRVSFPGGAPGMSQRCEIEMNYPRNASSAGTITYTGLESHELFGLRSDWEEQRQDLAGILIGLLQEKKITPFEHDLILSAVNTGEAAFMRAFPNPDLLDERLESLRDTRDSLSEIGEQEQLKLQMYMERMGKAYAAVSNVLKKMSDTQNAIIGNMK